MKSENPVLDLAKGTLNILLVGVGGQGTILASDVITDVAHKMGYDVKKAEIHGMSQRGGSVVSQVRMGKEIHSPIIVPGEVDLLIGFEQLEAVRYCHYVRHGGFMVINSAKIIPITVNNGIPYLDDPAINDALKKVSSQIYWVKGDSIAANLGNHRASNTVLLGAVSMLMGSDTQIWLESISSKVPQRSIELNRMAFMQGCAEISGML